MPLILGIETSGDFFSVALAEDQRLLYSAHVFLRQAQASLAAPLLENAWLSSGKSPLDLSAIAVGKGPGSYTGLRIGVSLVKGLCFGLGIPLLAVSSLENLAKQSFVSSPEAVLALSVMDARRDEVYLAGYSSDLAYSIFVQATRLGDLNLPLMFFENPVALAGTGSLKLMEAFSNPANWSWNPDLEPDARTTCSLAMEYFKKGKLEDPVSFEPEYVKPVYFSAPA